MCDLGKICGDGGILGSDKGVVWGYICNFKRDMRFQ